MVPLNYNFIYPCVIMHGTTWILHCIPVMCLRGTHLLLVWNVHVSWKYTRVSTRLVEAHAWKHSCGCTCVEAHMWKHMRGNTCEEVHVMKYTWWSTHKEVHMNTRGSTCVDIHVKKYTWWSTRDEVHTRRYTWISTHEEVHVRKCTCGSIHTWNKTHMYYAMHCSVIKALIAVLYACTVSETVSNYIKGHYALEHNYNTKP